MRALFLSLRSEFYKSRKTLAFWAAIVLPLVICSLIAFGFFNQSEKMTKVPIPAEALWMLYSSSALGVMGMLILPFYVIFMAFSVNNIEHKNDTWKMLFVQPLSKFSIYSAKYLYAVLLIFICLLLFMALTYLSANLLSLLDSRFTFNQYNPLEMLSKIYARLFLASLGILSLQFIISLVWGDFLKPMGIGFIAVIAGIITASKGWEYAYLIPHGHPLMVLTGAKGKDVAFFTTEIYSSLIYATIFFLLGYLIVSRKSVK